MLNKNNFFKSYFINSKKYNKNIKKTKRIFNSFLVDLKNSKIPLLSSYEKTYKFTFSRHIVKKFLKYENVIVIGMGGSILGSKSIYSFLEKKIKKKVFFFDNLDPSLNYNYKKIKNLKNSCFVVVSKSGNTLETVVNLSTIFKKNSLKDKLAIITESTDNALMSLAKKYNAQIIEHKNFIGGRYSVLSESGMFPAALMNLDLPKFKNLKSFLRDKKFISALIKNVAGIYTLNSNKINNSIILNYDTSLIDLGYWYQQLTAESLGKKGKGINPILSFVPKDHHSLLQLYLDGPKDKFFTFFNAPNNHNKLKVFNDFIPSNMKFLRNKNLKLIIKAQSEAIKNIFKLKKIPYREINFNKRDEETLGKVFTFLVLETILLSRLINVDPFSQPAVEQIKTKTKIFLK